MSQYKQIKVIEVYNDSEKFEKEVNQILKEGFEIISTSTGYTGPEETTFFHAIMGETISEIVGFDIDHSRLSHQCPVIFEEIESTENKDPHGLKETKRITNYNGIRRVTLEDNGPLTPIPNVEILPTGLEAIESYNSMQQYLIQKTDVSDLKCSEKLRNILRQLLHNINDQSFKNIFDLYTREEIKAFRGMGKVTINELCEWMEKAGLEFNDKAK